MRNRVTGFLAVGLLILWLAGLGSDESRPWLTWLDGLAAVGAFSLAAVIPEYNTRQVRVVGPLILATGLLAVWLVGVMTPGPVWQAWWTFLFGLAFVAEGVSRLREPPLRSERVRNLERAAENRVEDREKYRRGA